MECWKAIPGYEGHYEVSDLGRVRSLGGVRAQNNRYGTTTHRKFQPRILKQRALTGGYLYVRLCVNQDRRQFRVNRLVMLSFDSIPNPEKMEANHLNSDRQDNRLVNLQWNTRSQNQLHAHREGSAKSPALKGEAHPRAKLTEQDVLDIRAGHYGDNQSSIARHFDVGISTIAAVIHRRSWRHV